MIPNNRFSLKMFPEILHIETINGFCQCRCCMCTIESCEREPYVMTTDEFRFILKKFLPFQHQMTHLTLQGFGEPLLDREIHKKVEIANKMGFKGVGFATNCMALTDKMSLDLLSAGLDTLICSIDGVDKETHENIRPGSNFETVVNNVKSFINKRSSGHYITNVIIRFVRQNSNKNQWHSFKREWSRIIETEIKDDVIKLDVHNWTGDLDKYSEKDHLAKEPIHPFVCDDIFKRMTILSRGEIALCCGDTNGNMNIGNIFEQNPDEIYNNTVFSEYRKAMLEDRTLSLKPCNRCTIPRSRKLKKYDS